MRNQFLLAVTMSVVAATGSAQSETETVVVVDVDAPTVWIEPLEDLPEEADPAGWTVLGYDTSQDDGKGDPDNGSANWESGQHGVGYGDGDDATVITDDNNTFAIYTRTQFDLTEDLDRVIGMTWEVDFDDGYIAFLNGVEIARGGLLQTVPVRWDLSALGHESSGNGTLDPPIDVSDAVGALVEGSNMLAVATFNSSPGSSDMTMIPRLSVVVDNTIFSVVPKSALKEEGESHVFQTELFLPEPPVTYAWTHNGSPVGTNSSTLSIASLSVSDSGTYVCTVTDASTKGIFVTDPVTLSVVPVGSLPIGVPVVLVLFTVLGILGVWSVRASVRLNS